jgi:hypothetical protein
MHFVDEAQRRDAEAETVAWFRCWCSIVTHGGCFGSSSICYSSIPNLASLACHPAKDIIKKSDAMIDGISATITDPLFWAFGKVLIIIGDVLLWISAWVGGCPCHEGKYTPHTFYSRKLQGQAGAPPSGSSFDRCVADSQSTFWLVGV